jgi:hypothetical protein
VRRDGHQPLLFLNPADDVTFRDSVDALVAEGVANAADLERRLREPYPQAVVRPRDLADESFTVWYVYRDGHWVSTT